MIECEFQVTKSTVRLEAAIEWVIQYVQKQQTSPSQAPLFHQQTVRTLIPVSKSDQVTHLVAVLKVSEETASVLAYICLE